MSAEVRIPDPIAAAVEQVGHFLPETGDDERQLRARIMYARDIASTRSARGMSFDGRRLYSIAAGIASDWVFKRPASMDELQDVRAILARIFLSAGALERLEIRDDG